MLLDMMRNRSLRTLCIALFFLMAAGLAACGKSAQPYMVSGFYFDTYVSLTLYEDASGAEQAGEAFLASCEYYDHLFSKTNPESDIWRLNHAGGAAVEVSPETVELLELALQYYAYSDGAVDPCIGAVSSLWEFHESGEEACAPEAYRIQQALQHIDPAKMVIRQNTVMLTDPEMQVDVGFIAKGFIADRLKEELYARGIRSGILNLGGNVAVLETKPGGAEYTVGIEKPFAKGTPLYTIQVKDTSVVTSGVYERCFYDEGVLYHHILDPATGYGTDNGLYSITVVCGSSTAADALATACFVLGPEKGMQLIESTEGAEALFLDTELIPYTSSGFPGLKSAE